jgi:hypothetical protein
LIPPEDPCAALELDPGAREVALNELGAAVLRD